MGSPLLIYTRVCSFSLKVIYRFEDIWGVKGENVIEVTRIF